MGRPSHKIERLETAAPKLRMLPGQGGASGDDRDFVQVVARALDVMRCFKGAHAMLGNQDIATITGLPKSTVSRLTYTLTRVGHLSYDVQRQAYRPGDASLALSSTLLRGLEARAMIRSWLRECAEDVRGTWGMTIRDRLDMVYLEFGRAQDAVALQSTVGTRVPIARTAAGRGYLAHLAQPEQEAILAEIAAVAPDDMPPLRLWLEGHHAAFARDGYAISCCDWNPHINGIALPLYSPLHQRTFVFVVGVLAAEYSEKRLRAEVAPKLLELGGRVRALADTVGN